MWHTTCKGRVGLASRAPHNPNFKVCGALYHQPMSHSGLCMQIKAPFHRTPQPLLATSNYTFSNEPWKVTMTFHNENILPRIETYSCHIPTYASPEALASFVGRWAEVNNDNSKIIWNATALSFKSVNFGYEGTSKRGKKRWAGYLRVKGR